MKTNLLPELDAEIQEITENIMRRDPDFRMVDDHYFEVDTPFVTNPGAKNKEWLQRIGLTMYPKLLSYNIGRRRDGRPDYTLTPWISVRVEMEKEASDTIGRDLCRWLKEKFESFGYAPFTDEDAYCSHFTKEENRGYVKYTMYVNPSYPEGMWQNHTL